jgi:hypothetical protein
MPRKVREIQAITKHKLYLNLFPKDKERGTTFNIISSLIVQILSFVHHSFLLCLLTKQSKGNTCTGLL